ncbi:MAG: hypothetical protein LBV49_07710 [Azonexus sp.]|jgi:hypothetical protein|nr:hypothetical protein [Azonexus sp.]
MKRLPLILCCSLLTSPVWAQGAPADMPEVEKTRFCERVRDHAIQALYNRDRGSPVKLYAEDGSNGPRIVNVIIRHIYADKKIATPPDAESYGRKTCAEMMGVKGAE